MVQTRLMHTVYTKNTLYRSFIPQIHEACCDRSSEISLTSVPSCLSHSAPLCLRGCNHFFDVCLQWVMDAELCYLHSARAKWINGLTNCANERPRTEKSFLSGRQALWCEEIKKKVIMFSLGKPRAVVIEQILVLRYRAGCTRVLSQRLISFI